MQYRDILGVLAMMLVIGALDTVRAGETDKGAILANKFDEKCFDTIRDSMPPQDKPDESARLKAAESYGKLPLSFIRNDGQVDDRVRYYEKGAGHATYFTKRGVCLSLVGGGTSAPPISEQVDSSQANAAGRLDQDVSVQSASLNQQGRDEDTIRGAKGKKSEIRNPQSEIVHFMPLGMEKDVEIVAGDEQPGTVNYFIGNDPKKWKTNVPAYESVVYKGVYDGIDMKFYGNNRQMEYDIIVQPGASPSRVQLSYEGIEGLTVAENGDLEIKLKEGKIIQKKPYVYQEIDGKRIEINGKFRVQTQNPKSEIQHPKFIYGFTVASYDKRYPLVIDPVLVYSTYLGGSADEDSEGIAVDAAGNVYVTGETDSFNFPTASPYDGSFNGDGDAFVTKLNASGSGLVYSTYLGGSGEDLSAGIAVDAAGNAYVTGDTKSFDFPMSSPYDGSPNGYGDAFVTKLDASGSSLVYSTYLGGSGEDGGDSIAVDAAGSAYVTGGTSSFDFPTSSPYDGSFNGDGDAFVTKLNASGSGLVYSTYLGGSGDEYGDSIAVDATGNAYVTGDTESLNFPTASPYDGSFNGDGDVFVTKLNASGNGLVYSTYLGGSGDDGVAGIAVDAAGNAYVTGDTESLNFPMAAPYDGSLSGYADAFVTKLNASGSGLVYSTYLGGSDGEGGDGIAVDAEGSIYVTGATGSFDFPTASPYDGSFNGDADVFVTKLNASGSSLVYSTYLGGSGDESAYSLALDAAGNVYVCGETDSFDFSTASPYDGSYNGEFDAFVCKFGSTIPTPTPTPTPTPEPTPSPTPSPTPIKACYAFEEGSGTIAGDSSGNGNDGTVSGATWTTGKDGGGLSFNGVNNYVSIPLFNNSEVTVSAWFHKNAHDTTRNDAIFSGFRSGANRQNREGFELRFPASAPDTLEFMLVTQDGGGARTNRIIRRTLLNSVGNWYHAVGTYNQTTGQQKLYVNGELVRTFTHPAGNTVVPLSFYPDMRIGHSRINHGYFNGVIDDVRLYNYALNDQEIKSLYNAFTDDLQARYALDEGAGTIAGDSSGNGNHGEVSGGAAWTTGQTGNGLGFDGVDDSVTIPRINNDEVSVCAWFYKNANDTAQNDAIFGGFRNSSDVQRREGFALRFPPGNPDTLQFLLVTQDGSGTRIMRTAQRNLINSVGSWHHVTGTYNKTTGEQKLYVDGALVNTQMHSAGNTIVPLNTYDVMGIGHLRVNGGHFNGVLDDIRLYRRALTDQEALDIYNN
ncbi:MAG: hypothetical protein E3K33_00975 [Candidatus Brocadia sp.]|nr:hypothetical protein [Candidatus Brocadia fulgida]MDG5995526.1 hypothetical protein [Candidatus Brocadia sp.]